MTAERELLRELRDYCDQDWDSVATWDYTPAKKKEIVERIDALLAAPVERDAVIEQCARVCLRLGERKRKAAHERGIYSPYAYSRDMAERGGALLCADAIRALKSTERKEG